MTTFDESSTTDDVLAGVDLTGRRVLVTGASAGLGVETVRALTAHGASAVVGVRDVEKAATNLAAAGADLGAVELRPLDLASLAAVRAFTDGVAGHHDGFDALIANAGVMACPEGRTADGFETQFGTNHLGHFVLVNRLVSLLGDGGRIVNLTSAGHRFGAVDLDDPNFEHQPYEPWVAYGRSKTANVLFAVELDRRYRDEGVRAFAVHPGMIATDLARHLTPESVAQIVATVEDRGESYKSVEAGAATAVWAATAPELEGAGGVYLADCRIAPPIEDGSPGYAAHAVDPDAARRLWDLSVLSA